MRFISLLLFCFVALNVSAKKLDVEDVPNPLKPWVDWVLFDVKKADCPFIYNNFSSRRCAWPTSLELNISDEKARFSQNWQVFEKTWVSLPGDNKNWPQSVTINNGSAIVVRHNGIPSILLKKGKYRIKGNLYWEKIPESLQIPVESALVKLYIKGVRVAAPEINKHGRLWLVDNKATTADIETDKLSLKVYRLLDDRIPMRIVTQLDLQVSGSSREVNLGQVLLAEQTPISINSRLPALLTNDGKLRLQVKPGHWLINITSRAEKNVSSLALNKNHSDLWPEEEIWSFQAQNHLRIVKLEEATRIDPRQTRIPQKWKQLPTFRMVKDVPLVLKQIRRGDEQPQADNLKLKRQMWLDFNGEGYTVKDEIKGTISQSWRLEASRQLELGRVTIDSVPQFITQLSDNDKIKGIEVRRGDLQLTADSRLNGNVRKIPASGWSHEFKHASTTIHLPPGWRIFSVSGVDNVPQSWLQKWTLLDLFIVLIISISIARLWSWQWGVFGLVTMSLIWHESGFVPQFIWLNLLAVIAILKVIPAGKFQIGLTWYRNISIAILVLLIIPFMVNQVRTGLYPQLEKYSYKPMGESKIAALKSAPKRMPASRQIELSMEESSAGLSGAASEFSDLYNDKLRKKITGSRYADIQRFDPRANVQTGPGLPQWKWNKVYLSWNGPVQKDQQISLVLISPFMHTVLNFLRVIFVAILGMLILGSIPALKIKWVPAVSKLVLLAALVPLLLVQPDESFAKSVDSPDPSLLKELKSRLTGKPECLPDCVQIQSMVMRLNKTRMELSLNIHAMQKVAIPLPARAKQWMPTSVALDGRKATAMYRAKDGVLWLEVPKGRFNVLLSGKIGNKKYIQLPLQLRPGIVQSKAKGWSIEGVQENGVPDAQLQLTRELQADTEASKKFANEQTEALPPFLLIERKLQLGLDWFVETTVRRISPTGSPVVVNVSLLPGESVITEGVRSKDGKVFINMSPRQSTLYWRSTLEKNNKINLVAANNSFATELWSAEVSPIWHMAYSGIPVIKHKNQQGNWLPTWHPWPGEQLGLIITRPTGIEGNTLTIERSHLLVKPGKRMTESQLDISLRSSQGGQYTLTLPKRSVLQSVKINNASQSIRLEAGDLTFPITPGTQQLQVVWRNSFAMKSLFKTPVVKLNVDSVNHSINVRYARDRWVLMVAGPQLGPAVLFWGVLIVILVLAVALGYTSITPLTTLSWILLGVGLSQVPIWMSLIVVAWLFSLGLRQKIISKDNNMLFNITQVGIGALTFLALICLFVVIQQGLLGSPDMQVAGNGSSAYNFNWYQDRNNSQLPQAWLLSVPTMVYRLLMLAWALWLAFSLLRWLKWGWQQFSEAGVWRDVNVKPAPAAPAMGSASANVPKIEKTESSEE